MIEEVEQLCLLSVHQQTVKTKIKKMVTKKE